LPYSATFRMYAGKQGKLKNAPLIPTMINDRDSSLNKDTV
jgi:hypothetical protein